MLRTLTAPTSEQADQVSELVTETPNLCYDQLFGSITKNAAQRTLRPKGFYLSLIDSIIRGFGGARGAGKSDSLAYWGIVAMAVELPVWANFPIRAHYVNYAGHLRELESMPLYFKDLFNMSEKIRGGLILIDEYQDWASAFASMTTQNKLLNGFWAQIRKNDLSFYYAAKKSRWIDLRTREETDLETTCMDGRFWGKGNPSARRGETVYWWTKDMSGMLTGRPYDEYPRMIRERFNAKMVWGSFDTKQRFDIFEALRGIKLDLEKDVITDKQQITIDFPVLEKQIEAMFNSSVRIKPSEFWATLGISKPDQKAQIRPLMRDMGIIEKHTNGGTYLVLEGFASYVPSTQRQEPVDVGA